uniref:Peroxidase n=1 Tax=Fagus sylvatica TaxID=28930 RepID=A0A2N9J4P7_FAGSY
MASYNIFLLVFIAAGAFLEANGKLSLSPTHYSSTCPNALSIVRETVIEAINKETRIGASLLRLHFHDCFVNGCDASILLDNTSSIVGEKMAGPNNNSVRGFEVVDDIKAKLEKACPGVVSCADILALAAHDSVVYLGGPSWKVSLGRRDSTTANLTAANTFLPSPLANLSGLIAKFSVQGLSFRNLVALSGSHTIGLVRCTVFRSRIYNDTIIDASFANSLKRRCPVSGNDNNLAPLDLQTPTHFDNLYYKNLLEKRGQLHSDQELYSGAPAADFLVEKYAADNDAFFKDFARGMIKMGRIKPLIGSEGEVRTNCRKVN